MMNSVGCGAAPGEGGSPGEEPSAGAGASDGEAAGVEGLDVVGGRHMGDGCAGCADAVVGVDESEEPGEIGEGRSAAGADRPSGSDIRWGGGRWGRFEDTGSGPGSASAGNGAAERGALQGGAVVVDGGGTGRSTSAAAVLAEVQGHLGMDDS